MSGLLLEAVVGQLLARVSFAEVAAKGWKLWPAVVLFWVGLEVGEVLRLAEVKERGVSLGLDQSFLVVVAE